MVRGEIRAHFELETGEYSIGREESCNIVVNLDGIALRHAMLSVNGEVRIADLGSGEKTFVGGREIVAAVRLRAGSEVLFGRGGTLRLESVNPPEAELPAEEPPRIAAPESPLVAQDETLIQAEDVVSKTSGENKVSAKRANAARPLPAKKNKRPIADAVVRSEKPAEQKKKPAPIGMAATPTPKPLRKKAESAPASKPRPVAPVRGVRGRK